MRYLGFLCGVLILFSCESNEPKSVESELAAHGELYETLSFSNLVDGGSLKVKIMEIKDSRCLSDVVCVQAGWASANFEIMGVPSFSLKVGESQVFSFNGRSLKLTLADVVPFPSTTNQAQQKEAVFMITRQ